MTPLTHRIVLQSRDVGLDGSLHLPGGHLRGRQVDVSVDEVRLEPDGVSIVLQGLLQLAALLEHVAQVGVGLGQVGVLLDGQAAEVGGPEQEKRDVINLFCDFVKS